jgi:hypothetical protein
MIFPDPPRRPAGAELVETAAPGRYGFVDEGKEAVVAGGDDADGC